MIWVTENLHRRAYRMFKPALLQHGPHLFVDYDVLQVLQGRVLSDLLLKRQHVLIYWT